LWRRRNKLFKGQFAKKRQNSPFSIKMIWLKRNFLGSGQKVPSAKAGWPLINCGSKVCSGRVGSGPISRTPYWLSIQMPILWKEKTSVSTHRYMLKFTNSFALITFHTDFIQPFEMITLHLHCKWSEFYTDSANNFSLLLKRGLIQYKLILLNSA